MTLDDLKKQKRWVLWRLEQKPGADKPTKVPYQTDGRHARNNDPCTWSTYAECEAVVSRFSGIGVQEGEVDGVYLTGVDIDGCCDAATGKFSAESREIVIGLDSYTEYSPSGTGAHIIVIAKLADDKPVVKPFAGCKQVEIKGNGFFLTFTGRHIGKTPHEFMERQERIDALCARLLSTPKHGIKVRIPQDEEEKFRKLWAGDMSDYADDHSRADLALCCILVRRCGGNPFLIDEEFQKSGLYREKWDRVDYKAATIMKAIQSSQNVPLFTVGDEPAEDDSPTKYLVEALKEDRHEGWFPFEEVSLIGASSGAGKTYWAMTMLDSVAAGKDVWGHACIARDYRVLLHDRSKKAMRRTIESLGLPLECLDRIIRLSTEQMSKPPAEILDTAAEANPGVSVWFIEGLDLWIPKMNAMEVVAPVLDSLQRVARRRGLCVLASVGMPKIKGDDRYFGRDSLFGSAALARKVETIVLITLTDAEDDNSVRQYTILPRNGRAEQLYMTWELNGLTLTSKPVPIARQSPAVQKMEDQVFAKHKPGEMVVYSEELGPETTFYRWRKQAVKDGKLTYSCGCYFVPLAPGALESKPN